MIRGPSGVLTSHAIALVLEWRIEGRSVMGVDEKTETPPEREVPSR